MRNNRLLQLTMPGWLKWVLGIAGFLMVAIFIFGIYLYQAIQENRTASFDQVEEQVLQETALNNISKIRRFHGENAYYTVYGESNQNEAMIVFYPFDGNQTNIISVHQSEIIAGDEVRAYWYDQCDGCTLFNMKPAVILNDGKQPVWEMTYEDNTNHYVMEYLSFQDGSRVELIRFNQLYD
ncbi:DUF5590 domain-containing protein [Lentibacillus salicampi]|uniref:Cell wall elongation regulator TseB-like domain-containing protein n=1 Tax=Lentibacillus salicampi TaxID=175306 RepID=A0A4Y9AEI2_9BACI|nr:DUF5590 domain-containing protein [Lentibacillus salicampi]TFJ93835.1 hypothetical protein E4U82_05600 [Lentibacillus salicampi]